MTTSANPISAGLTPPDGRTTQPWNGKPFILPGIDDAAAKPRYADWCAELDAIQRYARAVTGAGLKHHGQTPRQVASDTIAAVADAVLYILSTHPDGDLSAEGIHAVITAAIEIAGQYDENNEGLAVMAALD